MNVMSHVKESSRPEQKTNDDVRADAQLSTSVLAQ